MLSSAVKRNILMQPKGIVQRGLVAEYRFDNWRNLLKWSEDFSNAAWTKAGVTLGDQITASGGVILTRLTETVANTGHGVDQNPAFADNTDYIFACCAKNGNRPWFRLHVTNKAGTGCRAYFDLENGVVGETSNAEGSIELLGDGVYLCKIIFNSGAGATSPISYVRMNDIEGQTAAYVGDASKYLYCGGAHLQLASQANQSYQKTTDGQTLWNNKREVMYPANIVTNGNFAMDTNADGVADDWVANANLTNKSVSSNQQLFTGSGSVTASINNWFHQVGVFSSSITSVWLVTFTAKRTNSSGGNRLYVGNGYNLKLTQVLTTDAVKYSIVFTPTNAEITPANLTFGADASVDVVLSNVMAINLSNLLGTGSEYTTQQAHDLFPTWFDGTATMELPKYNGYLGSTTAADANDPPPDGQGLSFSTDDYVGDVGGVSSFSFIQNTGKFTIIICAALTDHTADKMQVLLGSTGTTADKGFYFAWDNRIGLGTKQLRSSVNKGVGGTSVISSVSPENVVLDNLPHLFAIKGNGANINYVVDRTHLAGTSSMGAFSSGYSTRVINFGRYNGAAPGGYLDGKTYYGLIYDRELNGAEIEQNRKIIQRYLAERGVVLAS